MSTPPSPPSQSPSSRMPPPDDPGAPTRREDDTAPMTEDLADQWAEASPAPSSIKPLLKGLGLIASLAIVGGIAKAMGLADALDTQWLDQQVIGKGIGGEGLFILIGALLTSIGIPRQLVAFGGGYAFGLLPGIGISLVAQTLGCSLTFFYARLFGRSLIRQKFGRRIKRIDDFLRGNTISMTLLIRFLPVGSNVLTNLVVGVSSVRAIPFLIGTIAGYLPQTIIFSLLGTGVHLDTALRTSLSVALFVISSLISVALYRRVRHRAP